MHFLINHQGIYMYGLCCNCFYMTAIIKPTAVPQGLAFNANIFGHIRLSGLQSPGSVWNKSRHDGVSTLHAALINTNTNRSSTTFSWPCSWKLGSYSYRPIQISPMASLSSTTCTLINRQRSINTTRHYHLHDSQTDTSRHFALMHARTIIFWAWQFEIGIWCQIKPKGWEWAGWVLALQ